MDRFTNSDNTTLYGQRNGMVMHIDDVSSGLACGCTCLGCGNQLVARKGEIYRHHFAHHVQSENPCCESIVHKLSKDIIREHKKVRLPKFVCSHVEKDVYGEEISEKYEQAARTVSFSSIELEKSNGSYRPDVVGKFEEDEYIAIEIVMTNDVSEAKKKKIKALQHDVLRIYMSGYSSNDEYEILKSAVLYEAPRDWVFNSTHAAASKEIKQKVKERVQERNRRISDKENSRVASACNEVLRDTFSVDNVAEEITKKVTQGLYGEFNKINASLLEMKHAVEQVKEQAKDVGPSLACGDFRNGDVSLNSLSKRVIKERKQVVVPTRITNVEETGRNSEKFHAQLRCSIMEFVEVSDEQSNGYYKPDLTCITPDGEYIEIEIVKSEGLSEEKKQIINSREMHVLWINMSGYSPLEPIEKVVNAVMYEAPRGWV